MNTGEILYLGMVIVAALAFMVVLNVVAFSTERYLARRGEGERAPMKANAPSARAPEASSTRLPAYRQTQTG